MGKHVFHWLFISSSVFPCFAVQDCWYEPMMLTYYMAWSIPNNPEREHLTAQLQLRKVSQQSVEATEGIPSSLPWRIKIIWSHSIIRDDPWCIYLRSTLRFVQVFWTFEPSLAAWHVLRSLKLHVSNKMCCKRAIHNNIFFNKVCPRNSCNLRWLEFFENVLALGGICTCSIWEFLLHCNVGRPCVA